MRGQTSGCELLIATVTGGQYRRRKEQNSTPNEAKYYHFLIRLHWRPIGSYSSDDPQ